MNCKEFKNNIQDFLYDSLDDNTLSGFLRHLDSCQDCRDELSIQYLVYEGLERLEAGATFDVEKDLSQIVDRERKRLRFRTGLMQMAAAAEIFTVTAFFIVLALVAFY